MSLIVRESAFGFLPNKGKVDIARSVADVANQAGNVDSFMNLKRMVTVRHEADLDMRRLLVMLLEVRRHHAGL